MTRTTATATKSRIGTHAFALYRFSLAVLTLTALAGADDSERRLYEGTITANPNNPEPGSLTLPQQKGGLTLSARTHDVTAGIVEAFLHKEQLESGELQCLVRGTGDLAGQVMSVTQSLVDVLKEALNGGEVSQPSKPQQSQAGQSGPNDGADKISAMVDRMSQGEAPEKGAAHAAHSKWGLAPSNRPAIPEHQHKDPADKSLAFFYGSRRLQSSESMIMSVPMLLMQLGLSVKEIVGLVDDMIKECVRGDALKALKIAGKHLQDAEYVGGRLMANGADIASELSEAVLAYEDDHFRTFGQNLGKALRKVLLSQSVSAELPEGPPDPLVLANVSAGLLRGFFGEGFAVDLEAEEGYDPIHVDLHDCIGRNVPFFQSMFAATMSLYGKKASQNEKPEDVKAGVKKDSVQKEVGSWASALALAMFQIPTALRRCGLGSEQRQMLLNSIKTLGAGMHHSVEMPSTASVSKKDMATEMAKTVDEWAHHDWYNLGFDLGRVLQDIFVEGYSTKYSVDGTGTLRKRLIAEAASARSATFQGNAGQFLNALPAVPLAAVPLGVVALVLKARRELTRHLRTSADEASYSNGEDPEAVE